MAEEKSKILIIGGTGYIGKFIVKASTVSGHPTFALVRESTAASNPDKANLIEGFKASGVTLLYGDLNDHESLVKSIKQVDAVISAVGCFQLGDQTKIIEAIKEAGNVKRFFPSEFSWAFPNLQRFFPSEFSMDVDRIDVDRSHTADPIKSIFAVTAAIRRAVEASGIPYTYVSAGYFAGFTLPNLAQGDTLGPPTEKVVIFGDGDTKAILVDEKDIATYTIKSVDDPRTLNKIVYLRPPANIYTHNELIALWEKKSGKTFEKTFLSEEEVLKKIEETPYPIKLGLSANYSVFLKGDTTNFEIEPSFGVEATVIYPDVKYTTVEEYISRLFLKN